VKKQTHSLFEIEQLQITGSSMQLYIFDKNGHSVNIENLYVMVHNSDK